MTRAKTEATAGLKQLATYLRRDKPGQRMLDQIQRYLGELRQEKTTLKQRCTDLETQVEAGHEAMLKRASRIRELESQLNHEKSHHSQTKLELSKATTEVKQLEKQLEPDEVVSSTPIAAIREFKTIFRSMRRDMRFAPTVKKRIRFREDEDCQKEKLNPFLMVVSLGDIIKGTGADQFMKLGQFVYVCATLNFPAGIYADETYFSSHIGAHKSQLKPFMHFIRNWMNMDSSGVPISELTQSEMQMSETNKFRIRNKG